MLFSSMVTGKQYFDFIKNKYIIMLFFLMQTLNFWKILVMNDEHTDRKYILFFMLGWGEYD